ncbi:MAG: sugar phosphate isomerase/epimerase [Bryobacteraceae bacterium]
MQRIPISRRAMLLRIASSAVPPSAALAAPARLRLGFSLYALPKLPLSESIDLCRDIGYSGVELCLQPGWPAEPKLLEASSRRRLRDQFRRRRIELVSMMDQLSLVAAPDDHAANLRRIEEAARLFRDLSPRTAPLLETVLGGKPDQWEQLRETMVERLEDWARAAARLRIVIAIKAHVAGAVNQPSRLLWLLQRVNSRWIRAAYDYSHFQLIGLDLTRTIADLAASTVFVHVKDADGDATKFRFLLPGDGRTDYHEYFRLLAANNYRGWIVPEVSAQLQRAPGYDGVDAARRCYRHLAPILTEILERNR